MSIEQRLTTLLSEAAENLNLKHYTLNLNLSALKGEGFLSELYKVSITDNETNTTRDLVVKNAPDDAIRRNETCVEGAYKNEIYFYSVIVPALKKFQQQCGISGVFDSVPTYVASCSEIGKEMIALEDITKHGYQLRERRLALDDEHVRFVFQTYGRFHALSFCLRDQNPEEYKVLTKGLYNVVEEFTLKEGFGRGLHKVANKALQALDPEQDGPIREKFKKYTENTVQKFGDVFKYEGEYSGILHGDCWSNNFMFKYDVSQNNQLKLLESVKMLDFQLTWVGTPVYDLSYFFYSGGSKELFAKLESYLDVYHESFSKFAKHLGSDPDVLLPREKLTEDWKKYSKYGMLWALMLTLIKLLSKETSADFIESLSTRRSNNSESKFSSVNEEVFNERVRDILVHMYEIDAL